MDVRTATADFFKIHGNGHVNNEGNDRLQMHDALHTLLDCPETYKNEFIVAVYQSVLMDSPYVGVGKNNLAQLDVENVSFDDIRNIVFPGVEQFLELVEERFCIHVDRSEQLSGEEAAQHYNFALELKDALRDKFGRALRDVPVKEFLSQDYQDHQEANYSYDFRMNHDIQMDL